VQHRAATATTRTNARVRGRPAFLVRGDVLKSPVTGAVYRVGSMLGKGGFGEVYLAARMGRSSSVPREVCIKVSQHIDAWIREAYFGQLLAGARRAIAVYDRFALTRSDGLVLYYLAIEYARHGDLSAFLERSARAWSETSARREIAGILEVLGKLHRGQLLHRDLTPVNVFVCDNRRLKLGDFGIVRAQSDRRGVTANTLNPHMAPSDIAAREVPKWQSRDDVYQVGQLLGMLIKGDASRRIRPGEVRRFECSDHLKEIVYRCIGERRKRYRSADELIEALKRAPARLSVGVVRTLRGVHLAFTGILSKPRKDAAKAARRAGAIVHGSPSARTTVVVRGRPNALQAAGRDAGRKLMEIKRLREKGHRITLLDERRFWALVARNRRPA
jgi:serine/threonine-protein kinase